MLKITALCWPFIKWFSSLLPVRRAFVGTAAALAERTDNKLDDRFVCMLRENLLPPNNNMEHNKVDLPQKIELAVKIMEANACIDAANQILKNNEKNYLASLVLERNKLLLQELQKKFDTEDLDLQQTKEPV